LWAEADRASIGAEDLPIQQACLIRRREPLGESATPLRYRFVTPWLGLNQENHRLFDASNSAQRSALLERVLVGNCLSLAKAFDLHVNVLLVARSLGLWPVTVDLKGVPMVGFVGAFEVNFLLPDRIGLGKSVSRGFGTVERQTRE
jgi:hypothetical protein